MRLTLEDLGHRYGEGPWLFQGLSATLRPGASWAVVGPSGSGKSTLLWLLAGWINPSSGRIGRAGVTRSSWVPQHPLGVARRTALDQVVLALLVRGMARGQAEARATEVLSRFGLQKVAGRAFGDLSGGEAQRLMLARATVTDADLLLVDEPTAQLDARTAGTVTGCLHELVHAGGIVVVATHDVRVAARCDHVLELTATPR